MALSLAWRWNRSKNETESNAEQALRLHTKIRDFRPYAIPLLQGGGRPAQRVGWGSRNKHRICRETGPPPGAFGATLPHAKSGLPDFAIQSDRSRINPTSIGGGIRHQRANHNLTPPRSPAGAGAG